MAATHVLHYNHAYAVATGSIVKWRVPETSQTGPQIAMMYICYVRAKCGLTNRGIPAYAVQRKKCLLK